MNSYFDLLFRCIVMFNNKTQLRKIQIQKLEKQERESASKTCEYLLMAFCARFFCRLGSRSCRRPSVALFCFNFTLAFTFVLSERERERGEEAGLFVYYCFNSMQCMYIYFYFWSS